MRKAAKWQIYLPLMRSVRIIVFFVPMNLPLGLASQEGSGLAEPVSDLLCSTREGSRAQDGGLPERCGRPRLRFRSIPQRARPGLLQVPKARSPRRRHRHHRGRCRYLALRRLRHRGADLQLAGNVLGLEPGHAVKLTRRPLPHPIAQPPSEDLETFLRRPHNAGDLVTVVLELAKDHEGGDELNDDAQRIGTRTRLSTAAQSAPLTQE